MSIYATMKSSRTMDSSDAASTWMETDTTLRSVLGTIDSQQCCHDIDKNGDHLRCRHVLMLCQQLVFR